MPIVQVSVWEGITPENKKKTVEGITKVFEVHDFRNSPKVSMRLH